MAIGVWSLLMNCLFPAPSVISPSVSCIPIHLNLCLSPSLCSIVSSNPLAIRLLLFVDSAIRRLNIGPNDVKPTSAVSFGTMIILGLVSVLYSHVPIVGIHAAAPIYAAISSGFIFSWF